MVPPGRGHNQFSRRGTLRTVFSRRSAVLLAGALAAFLGMAVAASGSNSNSCDAHQGFTLLEDGSARVFSIDGHVSACARPDGRAHPLSRPGSMASSEEVSDIALAGGFVAWKRYTVDESLERSDHALLVLDLKNGVSRTVVAIIGPLHARSHFSLGDFVLNDVGTLVWLVNSSECGNPCRVSSRLSESRVGQPNSLLEKDTITGPAGGPAPSPPIDSLGLSRSGRVAYWIANGNVGGHHIP